MKKELLSIKTTLKFDWFELYDIKDALKESVKSAIELDNILGVKFPYYNTDKSLLKTYKRIVKSFKNYK